MKVGIFSPYIETMGGGERYILTVAEFFSKRGDKVDLFWDEEKDKNKLEVIFGIDLRGVNFVPDIFSSKKNLLQRLLVTFKYDLLFFLSDGSIPSSLAKVNILHFQRPFQLDNQKNLLNRIKLSRFNKIICNSQFTKASIDKTFGVKSIVLYPPVDTKSFVSGRKENIILSVGRFFSPSHPKKQEILIDVFTTMVKSGLSNYKLMLIGGVTGHSKDMVQKLRSKINGLPVEIVTDASFEQLQNYYARAKIFWHAAGFGEDLQKNPEKAEHFGIVTVEAMAAGCVPIVFRAGGQKEIVNEGEDGFFWVTTKELVNKTNQLINNKNLWEKLSKAAILRSEKFSKQNFFKELERLVKNEQNN